MEKTNLELSVLNQQEAEDDVIQVFHKYLTLSRRILRVDLKGTGKHSELVLISKFLKLLTRKKESKSLGTKSKYQS
jgi:hypothetical protein